jgi:hypothetical protein
MKNSKTIISLFSVLVIFSFTNCKNEPRTKETPQAPKSDVYVRGLISDPEWPAINSVFNVTITLVNNGKVNSGNIDLMVHLQRKNDGSLMFGNETIKIPDLAPGEETKVTTNRIFFYKEEGDYEFIVDPVLSNGAYNEIRWQKNAKKV